MTEPRSALVLFSGGQDSTTCLAWALGRYDRVETVGFSYGQRHAVELECREPIRQALRRLSPEWDGRLGPDRVVDLAVLGEVSLSALTADLPLGTRPDGLPATFVPGRTLVFLAFAGIVAFQRGIGRLVAGVCETDFSGYPDCRDETVRAMSRALGLGMATDMPVETPLMFIDKAETWRLARELGGQALVDLVVAETHTCYLADRTQRHPWGYGCGECDACQLRRAGWERFTRA